MLNKFKEDTNLRSFNLSLKEEIIFILPFFDQWLVHSPLHRFTTLVDEASLNRLKENQLPKNQEKLSLLFEKPSKSLSELRKRSGKLDPVFLGIIPTRACNLACRYCAFGAQEEKEVFMEHGLAISVVDWMSRLQQHQNLHPRSLQRNACVAAHLYYIRQSRHQLAAA